MGDSSTAAVLAAQWSNPTGFLSLLMLIGGPIIQAALAQISGPRFIPICFSFGWISYVFSMIPALASDGRLMPPVDYSCKVINLDSGYARTNRSWMIGRLLRDLEMAVKPEPAVKTKPQVKPKPQANPEPSVGLRVVVYAAEWPKSSCLGNGIWRMPAGWLGWLGVVGILCQFVISIIPVILNRDWAVAMITGAGTLVCLATAALPQWKVEKLACKNKSMKKIAITVGNGSSYVAVILGNGNCPDLEDMAAAESPLHARPWQNRGWFARPEQRAKIGLWLGLPIQFWATRIFWAISVLVCAALLLSVAALKEHAWFLIAVGAIGTAQNAVVAAARCESLMRGLNLVELTDIIGEKVMDVLMDLERVLPGCGKPLVKEFFPGGLDEERGEQLWWDDAGGRNKYDKVRFSKGFRGSRYDARVRRKPTRGWPDKPIKLPSTVVKTGSDNNV